MKILIIGDFHGKLPLKIKKLTKKCDFILSTGDFGGSDKLLKVIFKNFYGKWWEVVGPKKAKKLTMEDYNSGKRIINQLNKLGKPIYTIHGNWDFEDLKHQRRTAGLKLKKYSEIIKSKKNIIFINKKIVKINGLNIYAFGGMVTASIYLTPGSGHKEEKRLKYKKIHSKQEAQLFKKGKTGLDILLSHYPPHGYFDVVKYKGYNPMNGKHVGFKPYTEFIKKYQPRIFVCGHMHEHQGVKKLGKTLIVATGSVKDGKCAIIDYPENNKRKIKVKLIH